MADERAALAGEAFIYGFPLVFDLAEVGRFARSGIGEVPATPFNRFGHASRLAGPEATFVSINNDTVYSIAQVDLSGGPVRLDVPGTAGRYYVLQFVDAWTNNFAYIGRRATGTAEAEYLLVGEGDDGPVREGMTVVACPTGVFSIVGRVQVDGEADVPAVHALQDQFTLTPLSVHQGAAAPAAVAGVPKPDPRVGEDLAWWERFRVALAAFPPPADDKAFVALAERFGATAAESPYVDPDPGLAEVLVAGQEAGQARIEELAKGSGDAPGGWTSAMHLFDYNLDRLGPGTIDSPEWKIPDLTKAYATRAAAARLGLWGNHGYEAAYALIHQDSGGDTLNGAHTYEVTFNPPPPVDAFWSLTMYDTPDYHLVANPIDRYSIGDRTPGLAYGDDGSVTIYLQTEAPAGDKRANWLPAPAGDFRPILRMYQAGPSVLDGTYPLPPIRRTD